MTDQIQRREVPLILSFVLSFAASALATLAICSITPGEPVGSAFLNPPANVNPVPDAVKSTLPDDPSSDKRDSAGAV